MNYSSLHITTNFHVIKKWVEEREGIPARIHAGNPELTTLGICYPITDTTVIDIITWGEFFDEFASQNLAFMYQVNLEEESPAMFYKFVSREEYIDELVEEEEQEDASLTNANGLLQM